MFRFLATLVMLAFVFPANAAWHRAESDHFVIYADDSEKDLVRFAEMLERFHAAMSYVTQRKIEAPSPSNRVTVYAVGSSRSIRQLADMKNIGGFYIPRAGGSVAFVPNIRPSYGDLDWSTTVLLHEYAHHFLIGGSRYAMPNWMNEGGAEFFASARFPKSGEVQIGRPANHRAAELALAPEVPLAELLERRGMMTRGGTLKKDDFYGRSWALYHYLTFEPARQGQLLDYAQRVSSGEASLAAAEAAFGNIQDLEREVDSYLKQRRMNAFVLSPELLLIGNIRVERLSPGMNAMLPAMIRSKRGVGKEEASEVLAQARAVAASHPGDAGVLAALAEAEFDAGNADGAIAAADAALAIDPAAKNALVQKGYALFMKAAQAKDEDAAYAEAMQPFSTLNRLEQDHPLPLIYYYRSFVERGKAPNETARHALERAAELSPFDRGLAMNAGLMQAREGKIALARHTLAPVAANPHGGRAARTAQRYIDEMADVAEGTEWKPGPVIDLTGALEALTEENEDREAD